MFNEACRRFRWLESCHQPDSRVFPKKSAKQAVISPSRGTGQTLPIRRILRKGSILTPTGPINPNAWIRQFPRTLHADFTPPECLTHGSNSREPIHNPLLPVDHRPGRYLPSTRLAEIPGSELSLQRFEPTPTQCHRDGPGPIGRNPTTGKDKSPTCVEPVGTGPSLPRLSLPRTRIPGLGLLRFEFGRLGSHRRWIRPDA